MSHMKDRRGQQCSAYGCFNRKGDNGLSFHVFPKSTERKTNWVNALRRDNFTPRNNSILCSEHFATTDYIPPSESFGSSLKRRLKEEAVPSIFKFKSPPKKRKTINSLNAGLISVNADDALPGEEDCPSYPQSMEFMDKTTQTRNLRRYNDKTLKNLRKKYSRLLKKYNNVKHLDMVHIKLIQTIKRKNNAIKILRSRNRRLLLKVNKLNRIIAQLKKKELIDDENIVDLKILNDADKTRLVREILACRSSRKYSEYIQKFSTKLFYYSSKAYTFMRKYFNLPHPSTLRRWFSKVNCDPGFTAEAFEELKRRRKKSKDYEFCSLVIDEITIKKHTEWDHNKGLFFGLVDYGDGRKPEDIEATSVLTLMTVGLKNYWKIPIGYFLVNGVKGDYLSSCLKAAISKLWKDCNIKVANITSDGARHNVACFQDLGASFDIRECKPYFPHPEIPCFNISTTLDPPHMLKLIRNSWASIGTIVWPTKGNIQWSFITELNKLQSEHGLRLGNKLSDKHILFQNQKMKVHLAAQLFSRSVAETLRFLYYWSDIPYFKHPDVLVTAEFVQFINDIFDIFNAKRLTKWGYNIQLCDENKWRPFLDQALVILSSLEYRNGHKLITSIKKTGFLGFYQNIHSLYNLVHQLLRDESTGFKFLLTYKLSQDFIEIFFNAIRSRNGWNTNPTPLQFKHAYRQLLLHGSEDILASSNANTSPQDSTVQISLTFLSDDTSRLLSTDFSPNDLIVKNSLTFFSNFNTSNSKPLISHSSCLNVKFCTFCKHSVYYISGYAVKKTIDLMDCPTCISALKSNGPLYLSDLPYQFTARKNYSNLSNLTLKTGLIFPSHDVLDLCIILESKIRKLKTLSAVNKAYIQQEVINQCGNIFKCLDSHSACSSYGIESHKLHLCKVLINIYIKIRFHKISHDLNKQPGKRNLLHRSIIYQNL